jgi:hypothetical protein
MNERKTRILVCILVAKARANNKVEPGLTITSNDTLPTRLAQPSFSITLCYPTCSNRDQKLRRAGFATLRASCEGPRCIPSLSLHVPTTTPSAVCWGSNTNTKTTMGFTYRGTSQPLAHRVTYGRRSKRRSLSALSQFAHQRRQVDLWSHASLSFPTRPLRSWGSLEAQHNYAPSTAD